MWLALDTASDQASVALGRDGRSAMEETVAGARRHAAALLPMVQRLLGRARLPLDQVSGIVLSDGPGSFTGLRVGAAAAKALVHARGLPLWTAPSLMVRAAGVALDGGLVLAVADALRGELYAAAYRFGPEGVETVLAPAVLRPGNLRSGVSRPAVIVGEAPRETIRLLEDSFQAPFVGPPEGAPHASHLIDLVRKPGGARQVVEVIGWEPVYGRPAEAQVRWEKTHGRPLPNSAGRAG